MKRYSLTVAAGPSRLAFRTRNTRKRVRHVGPPSLPIPTPARCDPALSDGSLAALVHDLRGPLDAIRNAGYLLTLSRDDDTIGKVVSLFDRQVGNLSGIADRLAEMAAGDAEPAGVTTGVRGAERPGVLPGRGCSGGGGCVGPDGGFPDAGCRLLPTVPSQGPA